MNTYLLDKDFLATLDLQNEKEVFAKLISLDFEENPIEEIQGTVTGGSINVDGSSAVRRTCSLTLVAKDITLNDYYWGLNTKFKVEIGVRNKINKEYPEILWFPHGTFIISSFSESLSVNTYTINISGKDKMVLLNGEVGGTITASSWDFGTRDEIDENGMISNVDIPVKTIIRDAVHEFAKEPFANIVINDLDTLGIELMEYRGNKPLYMFIDNNSRECRNVTLNENQTIYIKDLDYKQTTVGTGDFNYDKCVELNLENPKFATPSEITFSADDDANPYTVAKIEEYQTAGYRTTEITYAGDLTIAVGGTVTQMLDKLVAMLGEFEYYYDVDGRFIFQKKRN